MILDNQSLPEIVVSREAVRNNNFGPPVCPGHYSLASACASAKEVCNDSENLVAPARKHESPQHRPTPTPRSPRRNHNEDRNPCGGDNLQHLPQQHQQVSPPAAGWDDAPGSPHRVPLVTNNNGSPRLTNRIANIYGVNRHQVVPRQQTVMGSPHGSPRHQAIARIVSPNPEHLRNPVKHLPKNDATVPGSPKFVNVCRVVKDHTTDSDQTVDLTQESCNSPKRIYFSNLSPSHAPGYHNPYQQTNFVKTSLLQSNETKFRYDSPKHKMKSSVDSPRHASVDKPPLSPRPHTFPQNSYGVDERRPSNDNSYCNDNECDSPGSFRLQKSRIPCKIPTLNQTDSKTTELVSAMNSQNNLRIFKAFNAPSPKKIKKTSSTQSHVPLDNFPNQDGSCETKTNTNLTRRDHSNSDTHDDLNDAYQYLKKADKSLNESNHSFEDSKSESDVRGQNSLGSTEWNSGDFSLNHPNTSSWNTNTEHSDCDQKMSIDDKHSLKRSSVDSLRPRTSSLGSWPHSSLGSQDKSYPPGSMGGSVGGIETISDTDSGMVDSVSSKMVLIKCKDGTYLSRVFLNTDGIQGVKVVGRVGGSGVRPSAPSGAASSTPRTTSPGRPSHTAPMSAAASPLHQPAHTKSGADSASGSCGGESCSVSGSERSGPHEGEFDHDTADYQWLLDYEYRESYTRESLGSGGGRDGSSRASVLDTNPEPDLQELSYETLSRNLDANLAEIDMDDFRSDDIHQLLTLPSVCGHCARDPNEGDGQASAGQSVDNTPTRSRRHNPHHHHPCRHSVALRHRHDIEYLEDEEGHPYSVEYDLEEEELSGVSGDISLCQSGPLFSPLKEPPPLGNTTFSVDSLDCDSLHEDLILTCQANKDNYTIAFEGSFIQYSEESDYQEAGVESASIADESDTTGSGSWPADRLEGRSPGPAMTHSDQPYTTWSRVSRRTTTPCRTPDPAVMAKVRNTQHLSPSGRQQQQQLLLKQQQQQEKNAVATAPEAKEGEPEIGASGDLEEQGNSKSNSMPNLMRRSLMRQSLDTGGQCIKVFDLQNSLRSSQTSGRQTEGNSFSLVRLFMKQKSLSKEAISLSSSCTSRSHEGACCTSSENQSGVDSSDWPMNSQSDDMEGSASPVPPLGLRHHHQQGMLDRTIRRRSGGDIATRNFNTNSGDYTTSSHNATDIISPTSGTAVMSDSEGSLVNNNNAVNQILDNTGGTGVTSFDNTASFEESLKEVCPCSKAPVTSPIREEPEGMDISFDSRSENKLVIDQSETETKSNASLSSVDNKSNNYMDGSNSPVKSSSTTKNPPNKNTFAVHSEDKQRSESPGTPKRSANRRDGSQRQRQDSGNSSSGYASTKGSTERIRRPSDPSGQHQAQRPRPKPRALIQMADQCLQTSNLKVSAAMNTSHILDRKDVYVYYPNYALPDLSFLKDKKYSGDARIFLVPQHYSRSPLDLRKMRDARCKRPFSCNDMEKLRRRGLAHVKDWDSLNVLLPKELKEMLSDNTDCMETVKPSFCVPHKSPRRPTSCDFTSQRQSTDIKESGSNSSLNSTQPSSGYRGSSTMLNESEVNASGDVEAVDNPPSIPKRSVSLQLEEEEGEQPPPRPPLPRGILRKTTSLKDDPQKQGVKKRHSAAESAGAMTRDDAKRRSLQEPMDALTKKASKEAIIEQPCRTEGDGSMAPGSDMGCSCINTCTGFCNKGLKKKNLLRVSELPDVSAHEEFTEQDLAALRARVSNFLVGKTMDEELECELCPKKSVTFEERCCTHMRKMGDNAGFAEDHMSNLSSGLNQQPSEERPLVYDTQDKRALVMSVRAAVERLVTLFSQTQAQQAKNKLTASGLGCAVSQITLDKLCPALYALLSDGLQPCLHSLFGRIANSVWRVIEATSQMGPSTKALNDLVLTLNSEDCLTEGPMKFNAFIFGLLNIRSLDSWLSYLRTRESTLQKHYHPDSFLYLANTATRSLYEDLLLALRPLSLLPLHLDLLYEYKLLHASLLKMEERLLLHTSGSATQSPLDRPSSGLLDHLLAAKETKEFKNTAAAQQDRVKALMRVLTSPEATEEDLLQTVAASVTRERSKSPRPRSCYDNSLAGDDLHPALKKRWSNVQLGSKLITAIDKLMLEEATAAPGSSGDYTDSIDNPRPHRISSICSEDEAATDMRVSDISNKDDDISERSATDKDTENEKGTRVCPTSLNYSKEQESEGEKFRRLQMKWERMAGCENKSKEEQTSPETCLSAPGSSSVSPSTTTGTTTVAVSPSQATRDKVVSPSSGTRSRIPRPVSMTSPQRPFKPFDPVKEKTSPQIKPPMHTARPASGPLSATSGKELPKPAPRRSLKDRTFDRPEDSPSSQATPRPISVRSRVAPKGSGVAGAVIATGNRASSMPGRSDSSDRGPNAAPGWGGRYDIPNKKASGAAAGAPGPRSASHGRRLIPGVVPRYVQTLHHRLATDNGHLSFNRGDVLTVVVEVDDRYLLCCLNDRKGLVPRASVIVCSDQ